MSCVKRHQANMCMIFKYNALKTGSLFCVRVNV